MRTRRALLGAVGAGTIALSGCVGSFLGDSCPGEELGTVEGEWAAHGGNAGHTGASDAGGFRAEPSLRWCDDLDGSPSSLLLSDGRLFEYVREGGLNDDRTYFIQAHDGATGDQVWRREIRDKPIGGIAVHDGGVFFTMDRRESEEGPDQLYRYAGTDGARNWVVDLPDPADSPPAVTDGTAYVVDVAGGVHAFDARSGEDLWSTEVSDSFAPGLRGNLPAVVDGTVYVSSAIGEGPAALDAANGEVLWQRDLEKFEDPVSDGDVVLGEGDDEVALLDAATGGDRWTVESQGLNFGAMDDDAVYCFRGGDIAAYDIEDGSELWVSRPPDPIEERFSFFATEDALLFGGDQGIAVIDPESGSRLWGTQVEFDVSEMAVAEGALFTADRTLAGFGF